MSNEELNDTADTQYYIAVRCAMSLVYSHIDAYGHLPCCGSVFISEENGIQIICVPPYQKESIETWIPENGMKPMYKPLTEYASPLELLTEIKNQLLKYYIGTTPSKHEPKTQNV